MKKITTDIKSMKRIGIIFLTLWTATIQFGFGQDDCNHALILLDKQHYNGTNQPLSDTEFEAINQETKYFSLASSRKVKVDVSLELTSESGFCLESLTHSVFLKLYNDDTGDIYTIPVHEINYANGSGNCKSHADYIKIFPELTSDPTPSVIPGPIPEILPAGNYRVKAWYGTPYNNKDFSASMRVNIFSLPTIVPDPSPIEDLKVELFEVTENTNPPAVDGEVKSSIPITNDTNFARRLRVFAKTIFDDEEGTANYSREGLSAKIISDYNVISLLPLLPYDGDDIAIDTHDPEILLLEPNQTITVEAIIDESFYLDYEAQYKYKYDASIHIEFDWLEVAPLYTGGKLFIKNLVCAGEEFTIEDEKIIGNPSGYPPIGAIGFQWFKFEGGVWVELTGKVQANLSDYPINQTTKFKREVYGACGNIYGAEITVSVQEFTECVDCESTFKVESYFDKSKTCLGENTIKLLGLYEFESSTNSWTVHEKSDYLFKDATIKWYDGDDKFINNFKSKYELSVNISGTYYAEIELPNGCIIRSSKHHVGVEELQVPEINDITICDGNSTIIDASIINPPSGIILEYVWNKDGVILNHTGSQLQVSEEGNYTVKIQEACNPNFSIPPVSTTPTIPTDINSTIYKSSNLESFSVDFYTIPMPDLGGDVVACNNTILSLANTYDSYLWSTGDVTPTISVSTGGTYWVEVTKNGCNPISSEPIEVTIIDSDIAPVISPSSPIAFCKTSERKLDAGYYSTSPNVAYKSYQWYYNNQPIEAANNREYIVPLGKSGAYHVAVELPNTSGGSSVCTIAVASPVVNVTISNDLSDLSLAIESPSEQPFYQPKCDDSNKLVVQTDLSGLDKINSLRWYFNNNEIVEAKGLVEYIATSTGSYRVEYDDGSGCSKVVSNPVLVELGTLPGTVSIQEGQVCNGSYTFPAPVYTPNANTNQIDLSGVSYRWLYSTDESDFEELYDNDFNGNISILSIKGKQSMLTVTDFNDSGFYVLEVSRGGCSIASTPVYVSVGQLDAPEFNEVPDDIACRSSFELAVMNYSESPNTTFKWYKYGSLIVETTSKSYVVDKDPGSYSVKVVIADGNGVCESPVTFQSVNVNPATVYSADLGPDVSSCTSSVVLNANYALPPGYSYDSYLWSTGSTASQITVNSTGVYWVDVTKNGCTTRDYINATVSGLEVPLDNEIRFCNINQSDPYFTLDAGNGWDNVEWEIGGTTYNGRYRQITINHTFGPESTRTQDVTVRVWKGGCMGVKNIKVIRDLYTPLWVNGNTSPTNISIQVECKNSETLTASLSGYGSNPYDLYKEVNWYEVAPDGSIGPYIKNSKDLEVHSYENYNVFKRYFIEGVPINSNGCRSEFYVNVQFYKSVPFSVSSQIEVCNQSEYVISPTFTGINGAAAGYGATVKWSTGWSGTYTNPSDVKYLSATVTKSGEYWVEVSKPGCQTRRKTIQVTFKDEEFEYGEESITSCNSSYQFAITDPEVTSASWYNSSGSYVGNGLTYVATTADTYRVNVVKNGCTLSDNVTLTLNATSPQLTLPTNILECTSSYTLDAGEGFESYTWTKGADILSEEREFEVTESGDYTVEVLLNNCIATHTVTVEFFEVPVFGEDNSVGVCEATHVLDAGLDNTYSFIWKDETENVLSTAQTLEVTTQGVYTLELSKESCSASIEIEVNFGPSLGEDIVTCLPEYPLIAARGYELYRWFKVENDDSETDIQISGNHTLRVEESGRYGVEVSNDGCSSGIKEIIHIDLDQDIPLIGLEETISVCNSTNGTITLEASSGLDSYEWYSGGSLIGTTNTIQASVGSKYFLKVTKNGCEDSQEIEVIYDPITFFSLGTDVQVCEDYYVIEAPSIFDNYTWYTMDNDIRQIVFPNNPDGLSHYLVIPRGADNTYYLDVASGDCVDEGNSINVTFNPLPEIDLSDNYTICEPTYLLEVPLDFQSNENIIENITWSLNDPSNVISTSSSFVAEESGVYNIEIETIDGCIIEESVELNFFRPISADLGDDETVICDDFLIEALTSQGVTNIEWYKKNELETYDLIPNETNTNLTVTESGVYQIRVSNENCSATDEITVTFKDFNNAFEELTIISKSPIYKEVLSASAVVFQDSWPLDFDDLKKETLQNASGSSPDILKLRETHPFYNAQMGLWRPKASFAYMDQRSGERNTTENLDLSKQGTFTLNYFDWSTPLEYLCQDEWKQVNTITQYSPYGYELENKDILGRYSSARYGYQGQLATAVGANARKDELFYESFEETVNLDGEDIYLIKYLPVTIAKDHIAIVDLPFDVLPSFVEPDNIVSVVARSYTSYGNWQILENIKVTAKASYVNNSEQSVLTLCGLGMGNLEVWTGYVVYKENLGLNTQNGSITSNAHTGEQALQISTSTTLENHLLDLDPGQEYVVSAWVKVEGLSDAQPPTYQSSDNVALADKLGIRITFLGNSVGYTLQPKGNIVEGWQRIEGIFEYPTDAQKLDIQLNMREGATAVIYDDIRLFPEDGNMQTYVYDTKNYRLKAVLDNNNYATLYYYDAAGNLFLVKKETAQGIQTIQESMNYQITNDE